MRTTIIDGNGGGRRSPLRLIAFVAGAVVVVVILFSIFSITRIGAGHVGVEINLAGSQRGPSEIPVRTGWVFYSPLKTQIIEFPTYVQTVKWTQNLEEGHPLNEELVFNSKEGQEVRADVSVSYASEAITQKTQAITEAERARNQLAVTQAEVAKTVAQAEGDAKSAIERARGEAESNRLRQASITPQLLELKRLENERARIEKWNGDVP